MLTRPPEGRNLVPVDEKASFGGLGGAAAQLAHTEHPTHPRAVPRLKPHEAPWRWELWGWRQGEETHPGQETDLEELPVSISSRHCSHSVLLLSGRP